MNDATQLMTTIDGTLGAVQRMSDLMSGHLSTFFPNLLNQAGLVLGQESLQFTEWSWPASAWEWSLLLVVVGLIIGWCIELYRRDSQSLSLGWRLFLPTLRIVAIIGLLIVFLNPRTRTQTWAERPSRVAVLVDVSSSMRNPARDPAIADSPTESTISDLSDPDGDSAAVTRTAEIIDLLSSQPWLSQLRQEHEVSVFTFDKELSTRLATLPRLGGRTALNEATPAVAGPDDPTAVEVELPNWAEVLEPIGAETRLAESVSELIREMNGRTLAGVVVVSDGSNNGGTNVESANDLARQLNVRLFALGTGGTEPPVNLEVAKLVAPSDVQLGDPFDIEAYIRGEGLAGRNVSVELLTREAGSTAPSTVVDQQEVTLLEDQVPVQVTFPRTPTEQGEWEYSVRIVSDSSIKEIKTEDNQRLVTINAFERPVKVLVFAGGPSWDYRFLCGVLKRHPGFEVDAYLQTGGVGISQDVDNILLDFPADKSALYEYDVAICFDPDWMGVPEQSRQLFEQWVGQEGGGAVFLAGDIHTPLLAADRDELSEILFLYPVFLDTVLPGIDMVSASTQVRPFKLTADGQTAPLLQVTEDPADSERFWEEFPGFYRFYPTRGAKNGAAVYALAGGVGEFAESEPPILLAGQFYGQGRTFYIGSSEFYRLRAEDPEYFERFWTRLAREAAQNRMRRSNPRGTLLVDQDLIMVGESIKIRARLLDAEFEPLTDEQILVEVEQPDGRLISPSPMLRPDPAQPGRYLGEVRGRLPGRYQIRLRIPGTDQIVRESVVAEVPDLENRDLQQNVRQLKTLTADTGGGYFPLSSASQVIPLLPESSEQFLLGEQIQTLWDRTWLMCVLIGLLGLEWLLRKLLRLA